MLFHGQASVYRCSEAAQGSLRFHSSASSIGSYGAPTPPRNTIRAGFRSNTEPFLEEKWDIYLEETSLSVNPTPCRVSSSSLTEVTICYPLPGSLQDPSFPLRFFALSGPCAAKPNK